MSPYPNAPKAALVLSLLAGLAISAGAALAAGKPTAKTRAAVLQAIVDCRPMTDEAQRLACYDAAAAKLDAAEAAGQVVVVDREQAKAVRKEIFGLQLPSLDVFNLGGGGSDKDVAKAVKGEDDDVDRITSTVKAAWQVGTGKWVVELETGAVWRQIDTTQLGKDPRAGSKIEIKRGAIGSFFMKLDGQTAIRAHRDR